jgi:hypothetical protein
MTTKLEELKAACEAADAYVVDACADVSITKAAVWAALDAYATADAACVSASVNKAAAVSAAKATYDVAYAACVSASVNKAAAVRAAKAAKATYDAAAWVAYQEELKKQENSND